MARSVYRTAAPNSAAMSPLMRERAMTRHLATIEVSLDSLKKAAKTADGTVNDAYLAAITGGLRRYHERHDVTVASLRAIDADQPARPGRTPAGATGSPCSG